MLCTRSTVEVGDSVVYTLMELPCSSLEDCVVGVVVTMKPCVEGYGRHKYMKRTHTVFPWGVRVAL